VQTHIVGVGTLLYLDLMHPAIPDEIKKELRFVKHVGTEVPALDTADDNLYGRNLGKFQSHCSNAPKFHPVVQCMLLYEMPESVVAHNNYCDIA